MSPPAAAWPSSIRARCSSGAGPAITTRRSRPRSRARSTSCSSRPGARREDPPHRRREPGVARRRVRGRPRRRRARARGPVRDHRADRRGQEHAARCAVPGAVRSRAAARRPAGRRQDRPRRDHVDRRARRPLAGAARRDQRLGRGRLRGLRWPRLPRALGGAAGPQPRRRPADGSGADAHQPRHRRQVRRHAHRDARGDPGAAGAVVRSVPALGAARPGRLRRVPPRRRGRARGSARAHDRHRDLRGGVGGGVRARPRPRRHGPCGGDRPGADRAPG